MSPDKKPIIVLAFANDRDRHLRNLDQEHTEVLEALKAAKDNNFCVCESIPAATYGRVSKYLNDNQGNYIALLHFGGHADDHHLLFESADDSPGATHAHELAEMLEKHPGLCLVFLNACSTASHATRLLRAGVKSVIATSRAVKDGVARSFAAKFYEAFGRGSSIGEAYKFAARNVKHDWGSDTRAFFRSDIVPPEDGRPWVLYPEDEPFPASWNLPDAVGNPTATLPRLPNRDLPKNPFLTPLAQYTLEEAEVFFGRGYQVRQLYERSTAPDGPPILLLYGQTGVGKSSLLQAGLQARLAAGGANVRYRNRNQGRSLLVLLREAMGATTDKPSLCEAWRAEEKTVEARPLFVILDQIEDAITRPDKSNPREVEEFAAALREAFGDQDKRPKGKLILGFRKEWLDEVEMALAKVSLLRASIRISLQPLDRRGILEAVRGPGLRFDSDVRVLEELSAERARVYYTYNLMVEAGLPKTIADDLLADPGSPIAPTLQVLLGKMWEQANMAQAPNQNSHNPNGANPWFHRELYNSLMRQGILLVDFLDQGVKALQQWRPEMVNSGLALDLLEYHTTPLGSAEQRTTKELGDAYSKIGEQPLKELVEECKRQYLLAEFGPVRVGDSYSLATRLSHDTLGPLVRQRFERSDAPGQRARAILEARSRKWEEEKKESPRDDLVEARSRKQRKKKTPPLDEPDLATVDRGEMGMRAWTEDQEKLVKASRRKYFRRYGWGLITIALAPMMAGFFVSNVTSPWVSVLTSFVSAGGTMILGIWLLDKRTRNSPGECQGLGLVLLAIASIYSLYAYLSSLQAMSFVSQVTTGLLSTSAIPLVGLWFIVKSHRKLGRRNVPYLGYLAVFATCTLHAGVVYYCAARLRSVQQLTHQFDNAFRSKFKANLSWTGTMKDLKLSVIIVKPSRGNPSLNDVETFIADWKNHDRMGHIAYVGFDDPIASPLFSSSQEMDEAIRKIIPGIVQFTQRTMLLDDVPFIGVFPATVDATLNRGEATTEINEARKFAEGFTRKLEDELRKSGSFTIVNGLDRLRQNGYTFVDGHVGDTVLAQTLLYKSGIPVGIFPNLQTVPVGTPANTPGIRYGAAVAVISYRGLWRNVALPGPLRPLDGATVLGLIAGSPAEVAGLKQYDKIVSMDGKGVSSGNEITERVSQAKPGESIEFMVEREGKQIKIKVVLGSIASGYRPGALDSAYLGILVDLSLYSSTRLQAQPPAKAQGSVTTPDPVPK
jgi:PDZ domain/CHAT domain/AAA ATPase domain